LLEEVIYNTEALAYKTCSLFNCIDSICIQTPSKK
jgi:hypothetical protein